MENKAKEENAEQEQLASRNRKENNKKHALKIAGKILEKILIIVVVIISLIIATQRLSDNEKSFFGYRIFRVQTGSMTPKYEVGDVILVKEKDTDQITIGEDVTYWGTSGVMKGKLVTHRVIDIETIDGKKVFHTQGIANNAKDPLVYAEQINGVVQSKLYILTGITSLLSNKFVFYFCIILPVTLLIFFYFIKANMKRLEEYK